MISIHNNHYSTLISNKYIYKWVKKVAMWQVGMIFIGGAVIDVGGIYSTSSCTDSYME